MPSDAQWLSAAYTEHPPGTAALYIGFRCVKGG